MVTDQLHPTANRRLALALIGLLALVVVVAQGAAIGIIVGQGHELDKLRRSLDQSRNVACASVAANQRLSSEIDPLLPVIYRALRQPPPTIPKPQPYPTYCVQGP